MGRTIVRREFGRTRANSPGFAANSREFANCSPTFFSREHWRTIGEHSANSREHWRSSREFARIRAEFAANWRTVRQKSVFIKSFSSGFKYSANDCSPRTIVRRERLGLGLGLGLGVWLGLTMTITLSQTLTLTLTLTHNPNPKSNLNHNPNPNPNPNPNRSRRTIVRGEQSFAIVRR